MATLASAGLLGSLIKFHLSTCGPGLAKKVARELFDKAKKAYLVLKLVHSDFCRPMNVMSQYGAYNFVTL